MLFLKFAKLFPSWSLLLLFFLFRIFFTPIFSGMAPSCSSLSSNVTSFNRTFVTQAWVISSLHLQFTFYHIFFLELIRAWNDQFNCLCGVFFFLFFGLFPHSRPLPAHGLAEVNDILSLTLASQCLVEYIVLQSICWYIHHLKPGLLIYKTKVLGQVTSEPVPPR